MDIKSFFNNTILQLQESLDDLPALQNKINSFFLGAELLTYLRDDNSLSNLLNGRICVSEATLTHFLGRALANYPLVKCVSVKVKENFVVCNLEIERKSVRFHVSINVKNISLIFDEHKQEISFDIQEFPSIKWCGGLKSQASRIGMFIYRKLAGESRVYKRLASNINSLDVEGRTFKLDLARIPACRSLIDFKMYGISLSEILNINRVELRSSVILINGKPRIPVSFVISQIAASKQSHQ